MNLKNKKTGEIGTPRVEYQELYVDTENGYTYSYKSLQKMCEEWEDYEEAKGVQDIYVPPLSPTECVIDFGTKEEAEKAVEKLKAWKRLKDKGFKIKGWKFTPDMKQIQGNYVKIEAEIPQIIINKKDIDLLFGGEE